MVHDRGILIFQLNAILQTSSNSPCLWGTLGPVFVDFVHFWWILDRLDPSSDPILRVSSLFQFESALYHAFPSADGLNTSRTFQMHQDA
jgi:hypothetical protein